ncbi:7708_t:CDS:2 [Cetraspora pellucida]|uniref:7708_t:CDS:1 n=1 Tax=Cetraspora pellucida TaxID=1433469 RepID=A0A9N9DKM1_9GLOM|nr:7708_t:CDS:2 [Cetraspora pellucida]
MFAKMFGPAYIKTYTLNMIINAYKATGIWSFNPNTINPDSSLKNENKILKEELETFKNPRIYTSIKRNEQVSKEQNEKHKMKKRSSSPKMS